MSATIHYLHQYRTATVFQWPEFKLAYIVHWLDTHGDERYTKVRNAPTPAAARIAVAAEHAEFEDFLSPVRVVRDRS